MARCDYCNKLTHSEHLYVEYGFEQSHKVHELSTLKGFETAYTYGTDYTLVPQECGRLLCGDIYIHFICKDQIKKKEEQKKQREDIFFATFEAVLSALKEGHEAFRISWNESDTYIKVSYLADHCFIGKPFFYLKKAEKRLSPWIPSQDDLFAEDWVIVKNG